MAGAAPSADGRQHRSDALEALSLLDAPADWEVVALSSPSAPRSPRTLGYDIGWPDGFYSIVADAIISPMWHGVSEEDLDELATRLRRREP